MGIRDTRRDDSGKGARAVRFAMNQEAIAAPIATIDTADTTAIFNFREYGLNCSASVAAGAWTTLFVLCLWRIKRRRAMSAFPLDGCDNYFLGSYSFP